MWGAVGGFLGDDWTAARGLDRQWAQVKGFATIDNVSLIEVMGSGMVGVPGTASSIFSSVRDAGINVIMISQSSSEHSVSVCHCTQT